MCTLTDEDAHTCARNSCHRCMKHASAILFANLTLRSVHPPHPPRILAGEHPAGTRGGRRRAVSGDAREGTPQLRLFLLLIIYNKFRKLQDPIIKTQMRSRSRRVPAGRFKIPILKKVWKFSIPRSRYKKLIDFKIPACLIRVRRDPEKERISD